MSQLTYLEQIKAIVGKDVRILQKTNPSGTSALTSFFNIESAADHKDQIATFSLIEMPGCCGVCISYHAEVKEPYRRKGLGTLLNKLRKQVAWDAGYTLLLCTDKDANTGQQLILKRNGWKSLFSFKNRRTYNKVSLHGVELGETGSQVGYPADMAFKIFKYC